MKSTQAREAQLGPGGPPTRGTIDKLSKHAEDEMEPRIARLEGFADECGKDIRFIDVRLAKIETLAESCARNAATKADVASLESTLIKWFLGTATAIAGLAFAAARLVH